MPLIILSCHFEDNLSDNYGAGFICCVFNPITCSFGVEHVPVSPTTRLGTLAHTIQRAEKNTRIKIVFGRAAGHPIKTKDHRGPEPPPV